MTKLHYNYNYLVKQRDGYHARQVFNSAKPSTYVENYHFRRSPKLTTFTAFVWMLVVIGCGWGIYHLVRW